MYAKNLQIFMEKREGREANIWAQIICGFKSYFSNAEEAQIRNCCLFKFAKCHDEKQPIADAFQNRCS